MARASRATGPRLVRLDGAPRARDNAQARRFLAHLAQPHELLALAPARDPTVDFGA
jgi:hypothetical protein